MNELTNLKKRINYIDCLLVFVPIIFYLFFSFFDGAIWCTDTYDYVNLTGRREPLYPLLVNLFRVICFNNEVYKTILIVFQGLLLAFSIINTVLYIKKEFKTKNYILIFIEVIFLSVSLLCRFAAKRSNMYSNCILSEGITIPLFILFFRYVFDYLINDSKRSFSLSVLLSFLLIFGRKQMYVSLGLLMVVLLYKMIIKKSVKQYLLKILLCVVIIVGGTKSLDLVYMKLSQGINSTHTSDNRFVTTMIFYTADRSDGELILDKETRDIFYGIYDECDKNGYLKDCALTTWRDRVKHFTDNYDNIQIDTMVPMFREYASTNEDVNVDLLVDKYNSEIIKSLIFEEASKIFSVLIDSFLAGLMITISADREIFIYYSLIAYSVYIGLLVYSVKKNGLDKTSLFSLLTLISILGNVLIVSAVIFNQTRYTIYNMPLFYIAGLLMLYNLFIDKKKVNSYEENK